MRKMKKGFTLVELAIVLVIVGLLTGGILVAKSMILTAKINKLVADIGRYEIAVNNFYMNYKQYPGDSIYFTPPGNGDGGNGFGANGSGQNCAAPPNGALSNLEATQVWTHLSQAHMLDVKYVPYSPILPICPGTQTTSYSDPSLAGIVWPYTELDSNPVFPRRWYIAFSAGAGFVNKFSIIVNYNYVLAMESKMGGKDYDVATDMHQTGLINRYNKGNCKDKNDITVSCNATGAIYGDIRYHFPPQ